MKEPLVRTKVLIRHLPPSLSQSDLLHQIDHQLADRYNWLCFRPGKNRNGQPSNFVVCQICGKKGHIALECYHMNNFSYQGNPPPPSLTSLSAQTNLRQPNTNAVNDNGFNAAETWILDTGATHHMMANATNINQAAPYNGNEKIIIGNGEGQGHKGDFISRNE